MPDFARLESCKTSKNFGRLQNLQDRVVDIIVKQFLVKLLINEMMIIKQYGVF